MTGGHWRGERGRVHGEPEQGAERRELQHKGTDAERDLMCHEMAGHCSDSLAP